MQRGLVHYRVANFDAALSDHLAAIDDLRRGRRLGGAARLQVNVGSIQTFRREFDAAEHALADAIDLSELNGQALLSGYAHHNLGHLPRPPRRRAGRPSRVRQRQAALRRTRCAGRPCGLVDGRPCPVVVGCRIARRGGRGGRCGLRTGAEGGTRCRGGRHRVAGRDDSSGRRRAAPSGRAGGMGENDLFDARAKGMGAARRPGPVAGANSRVGQHPCGPRRSSRERTRTTRMGRGGADGTDLRRRTLYRRRRHRSGEGCAPRHGTPRCRDAAGRDRPAGWHWHTDTRSRANSPPHGRPSTPDSNCSCRTTRRSVPSS